MSQGISRLFSLSFPISTWYPYADGGRGEHPPGAAAPLCHRLWPGNHFAFRRAALPPVSVRLNDGNSL